MNTYLCTRTDQQRTNIKRCTAFIRRNETLVCLYNHTYSFTELFSRQFRHQNTSTSTLQTFCISLRTEYTDFSIFSTISLQSFESFLSVMQTSSSHMNIQCFFRTKFQFTPLSVAIVATYIVICLHITERQFRPIYFFHC